MSEFYGKKDPRRRPAVKHHRGQPARPARHRASPDPSDLNAVRRWVASRERPTAIDLFAGAGGLSLGLEQAGFDVIVGADSDAWAMETHGANLAGLTYCGDLSDPAELLQSLEVWGISRVDLVAGGVPCQPFSRAGRSRMDRLVESGQRSSDDARVHLWESFVEVVERLTPTAVLIENVPDLPRWNDGAVLLGFYERLGDLGYTVDARIMDGFRFGVPQHRQRLIVQGLRGGRKPKWPEAKGAFTSLQDAIGDLPIIPRAQRAEALKYDATRQTSAFQAEMRAGVTDADAGVVTAHITRDVRPDDLEAFSLLEPGQTYIDLPARLQRYRSDVFTDKYKRLKWTELSRTITAHIAKDGYWYIHPDQHRTLSVREAARIQTFPDSFVFAGTQTHRFRQIGNAVPVTLGRVVGASLLSGIEEPDSLEPVEVAGIRPELERWSADRPITHPWRDGREPAWMVLLGELCLKRTRASDMEAMYRGLERLAPSPAVLAAQPETSVRRLKDLGLKASAELAVEVAIVLVERHSGQVPDDEVELRLLPGVGDYMCQAVRCFGFGHHAVLVDQNTARVAGRLVGSDDHGRRFQLRVDLYRLAGAAGPDIAFNAAMLDVGTSVCLTRAPRCGECPLSARCASTAGGEPIPQLSLATEAIAEQLA